MDEHLVRFGFIVSLLFAIWFLGVGCVVFFWRWRLRQELLLRQAERQARREVGTRWRGAGPTRLERAGRMGSW
jgi:hypothetical protein